jgi:hypothetical protein
MKATEAVEAMTSGKAAAAMDCTGDIWSPSYDGMGYSCRGALDSAELPSRFEPYRPLVFAPTEATTDAAMSDAHPGILPCELEY